MADKMWAGLVHYTSHQSLRWNIHSFVHGHAKSTLLGTGNVGRSRWRGQVSYTH
jgi:hypothetical protein